jgi:hypothetical protein
MTRSEDIRLIRAALLIFSTLTLCALVAWVSIVFFAVPSLSDQLVLIFEWAAILVALVPAVLMVTWGGGWSRVAGWIGVACFFANVAGQLTTVDNNTVVLMADVLFVVGMAVVPLVGVVAAARMKAVSGPEAQGGHA